MRYGYAPDLVSAAESSCRSIIPSPIPVAYGRSKTKVRPVAPKYAYEILHSAVVKYAYACDSKEKVLGALSNTIRTQHQK